jgi:hypothetical protein
MLHWPEAEYVPQISLSRLRHYGNPRADSFLLQAD